MPGAKSRALLPVGGRAHEHDDLAAGRVYGVQRVFAVSAFPRATYYAAAPSVSVTPHRAQQTWAKTTLDDPALLALIRADLAASPFSGEGHRKVFGRL